MARFNSFGANDTPLVEEGDSGFVRFNARLRPDQLKQGELAMSINGRMDKDGAWQVRKGINNVGLSLTVAGTALTLPFYLGRAISTASRTTNVTTIVTSAAHGFSTGDSIVISGLTVYTTNPNGTFTITVTNSTTFTYANTGGNETFTTTGAYASDAILTAASLNGVFGSCSFSDPNSQNAEYIILATYDKAIAVSLVDYTTTNITYPASNYVTTRCQVLQAFNKVYIFRGGQVAMEWNGVLTGSPAFALVSNGAYTQPTIFSSSSNTAASGGVVTVTEAAHGLSVGDTIEIMDVGSSTLVKGTRYTVATVPGSGSFTFYASVKNFSSTTVILGKPQSQGRGFSRMPAPPWAIYAQRRLWMPFFYSMTGTPGTPTITDRAVRDEIIASDILDGSTYDQIQNQYRIASGGADYVVALHAFANNYLIVFMRRSIHLITGINGDLANTSVQEITREVGCVARESVVQVGNQVLFLSDNGVYAVDFGDLYNLRGAIVPLSADIQPIMDRITSDAALFAVGVYHDNRYWLSVPLDGDAENRSVLIYNFINQGWESVDDVNRTGWDVISLVRTSSDGFHKLFAVSSQGAVHELEARDDNMDVLSLQVGGTTSSYMIESEFTTRQYIAGTMERKRYNAYEIHVESSATNESDAEIALETANPDNTVDLGTISDQLGANVPVSEDASIRGRCGNVRGYGAQLVITPTQGRPIIRAIRVIAQPTDLSSNSKE